MSDNYNGDTVQQALRDAWRKMNGLPSAAEFEQLRQDALTNPEHYRDACSWPGTAPGDMPNYRYWQSDKKRRDGREERWCYAATKNIGGWFMGWRELVNPDGSGERDEWFSRRRKKDVMARCERKAGVAL